MPILQASETNVERENLYFVSSNILLVWKYIIGLNESPIYCHMFNIRPDLKGVDLKEIVGSSLKRNIVVGNKVLFIQI